MRSPQQKGNGWDCQFLYSGSGLTVTVGRGSLDRLRLGEPDPAPIPSPCVAAIKGVLLALCVVALAATLRAK